MQLLDFLNFLGLNLAVLLSAALLVLRLQNFKVKSISKFIIATLLSFFTLIMLIEVALGISGLLTYKAVTITTYGLFAALICGTGLKAKNKLSLPKAKKDLPPLKLTLLLFLPIIAILFVRAFNVALQIPMEYDSIAYHLPFVAEWIQHASLNEIYYSAFSSPIAYYPSNYELLDLWTFLPFHNDFFANLLNFFLYPLFALVIWRILREQKISKQLAIVITAIPFYMPIFLLQAGVPRVDLFFTLAFALALYFAQQIYHAKKIDLTDFLYFGLSIGLFIGTKYLGLVYGAVLVLALAAFTLRKAIQKKTNFWHAALLTIIGILLSGGYFYIRNWINAGNPLFPVDVHLFGFNILPGYKGAGVNEMLQNTTILHNITQMRAKITPFFHLSGVFGFFTLLLPALIAIRIILKKSLKKEDLKKLIILATLLVIYTFLYIKAPYTYRDFTANIRYAMPLFLLGTLATGYLVHKTPKIQTLFYYAIGGTFLYSFLLLLVPPITVAYTDHLNLNYQIIGQNLYAFFYFTTPLVALICTVIFRKQKAITILFVLLAVVTSFKFSQFAFEKREELRDYWVPNHFEEPHLQELYRVSEWFNANAPEAKIAYTGFNFHYYLFGRNFQREVDYININDCQGCRYVDFRNAPNSIRTNPDYESWMKNLRAQEKEYLVVSPLSVYGVESFEFLWAVENPEIFTPQIRTLDFFIFKIN